MPNVEIFLFGVFISPTKNNHFSKTFYVLIINVSGFVVSFQFKVGN